MRIISLFIILYLIVCGCNNTPEKKKIDATNDCAFLKQLTEPSDSAIEININEFDSLSDKSRYDLMDSKIQNDSIRLINFKLRIKDSIFKISSHNTKKRCYSLDDNYIVVWYFNKKSIVITNNENCNLNNLDSNLNLLMKNENHKLTIYVKFFKDSDSNILKLFSILKKCIQKKNIDLAFKRFNKSICKLNKQEQDTFLKEKIVKLMLDNSPPPPTIEELKNVRHSRHN